MGEMTQEEKTEHLERQHTKELLGYLSSARACGGSYSPWDYGDGFTIDEIKAVLATREHIPNKQEAKKIRQMKAKNRQH